ncbi:MAG: DUF5818 domain-containing protein [Candidatus Acidiferrales bacterium]
MKNKVALIGAGGLMVFALCAGASGKNAIAQTRLRSFAVPVETQQQTQQPSQEFQGTIEKTGTKYVLKDKASGATYQLNNQDKAKQFFDKDVKVTGTLDPSTNTIEVSEIQEMK